MIEGETLPIVLVGPMHAVAQAHFDPNRADLFHKDVALTCPMEDGGVEVFMWNHDAVGRQLNDVTVRQERRDNVSSESVFIPAVLTWDHRQLPHQELVRRNGMKPTAFFFLASAIYIDPFHEADKVVYRVACS